MAKLSANGLELARFERERSGIDGLTDKELDTRSVRRLPNGNLVVMEKHNAHFLPDWLDKDGRWHDFGWKRAKRFKDGVTLDKVREIFLRNGWREVAGALEPGR